MPVGIFKSGEGSPLLKKCHRSGTLPADLFQQRKIVPCADAKIPGDDFAFGLLRQDTGKEGPAFPPVETLLGQRQGTRKRAGRRIREVVTVIFENHLAVSVLGQAANPLTMEVNIKRPRHGQFPFRGSCPATLCGTAGGVKLIVTPSVFNTVSTLPI